MDAEVGNFIKIKGNLNNYVWYVVDVVEDNFYLCRSFLSYKKKTETALATVDKRKVLEVKVTENDFVRYRN